MTRVKTQPQISDFTAEEREAFIRVYRRFSADPEFKEPLPGGSYFGCTLHSPILTDLLSEFGRRARLVGETPGSFSHADREFVDQVLCADMGFDAIQEMHLPDAVAVGVRIEAIEALRAGRDQDLTEDERLLATFVRGVAQGTLTDETWQGIVNRMGLRGAIEYAMFSAFLPLVIRLYQAFGIEGWGDAEVRQAIARIKDGSLALPDWRRHIR